MSIQEESYGSCWGGGGIGTPLPHLLDFPGVDGWGPDLSWRDKPLAFPLPGSGPLPSGYMSAPGPSLEKVLFPGLTKAPSLPPSLPLQNELYTYLVSLGDNR